MKLTKKLFVAVPMATLAILVSSCGTTYTLPAGTYEGTYTCEYEVDGTSLWGYTASFEVDNSNYIWYLTLTTPTGYSAGISGMAFTVSKFTEQFSGDFTVNDVMNITVTVNDDGYPEGSDCISSTRTLTIIEGSEAGCGIAILAMQDAITTALE